VTLSVQNTEKMQPNGTIICFLCKGFVSYKEGDSSKFTRHMNNEHMAYFGMEYLLAGCSMSEEERLAVRDVIKDRIEPTDRPGPAPNNTVVATLEEIDSTVKTKSGSRFPCSQCPISFTMDVNLKAHMEVHKKQARLSSGRTIRVGRSSEILEAIEKKEVVKNTSKNADTVKEESNKSAAELSPKDSKSNKENLGKESKLSLNELKSKLKESSATVPVPKSKKQLKKLKSNSSKLNKTGTGSTEVASPDQDPGDGNNCPVCSKEFKTNGPMRRHFEDIHQPGEFPCKGCGRVFTSKNKVSSHFSRNCKDRRKTL